MPRERTAVEFFDPSPDDVELEPRLPIDGDGVALADLPRWPRVAAGEAALAPLHRFVFGRLGRAGERRAALGEFRGFPSEWAGRAAEHFGACTKAQIVGLLTIFGLNVGGARAATIERLVSFLQCPNVMGKGERATRAKGAKRATKKEAGSKEPIASNETKASLEKDSKERASKEKAKGSKKRNVIPKSPSRKSKSLINVIDDNAIRVAVFRKVLRMTSEQRATLSLKSLRETIEVEAEVEPDSLKERRDIIEETAREAITALVEAEGRGAAVAPQTN